MPPPRPTKVLVGCQGVVPWGNIRMDGTPGTVVTSATDAGILFFFFFV